MMTWNSMFALWVSLAVVTSSVIDPITSTTRPGKYRVTARTPAPTQDAQDDTSNIIIDGIRLTDLTPEETSMLLEDLDTEFTTDLDKNALRELVAYRKAWSAHAAVDTPTGAAPLRRKRAWPILIGLGARAAFGAARSLFRGAARGGLSRSGTRLTQQYTKSGGLQAAQRDFARFGVNNSKNFNGKFSGTTGTVGKHRVTVRNGSSNGSPTLEIRTPKAGGEFVRKFRYPQ